MFILIVKHPDKIERDYYGPFGTVDRAHDYAKSINDWSRCILKTEPLNVPYSVVKQIVWRSNNN